MKEIKITNSKALGAEIRFSRKQQELTQMELSRLANTGVRFISDLENGKPDVSLSKLLSVVYALGLELRIVNKWSD
ncbi:MAG: helix-turn-helix domain-containing protein [Alphaproteobacteria bacterium]|nr:helix-turn-helix domain-containing protein [Alphaproteobacteria bacterium]MDY4689756.1 helix-turn-helix domain-containing protein [Alphaproteobacteria bacterium]